MGRKKKSEYQKLLDLLNEYEEGKWQMTSMGLLYALQVRNKGAEVVLKSMEYGFIEWLVRNDHIDFKKLDTPRFNQLIDNTLDSYLALLMVLAIQDEPVRFISKLLK